MKEQRVIIDRFIYAIKITLIEKISFTQFRVLLHCVFCWMALNGPSKIVVPVISPINTMSSLHHPVWTDD
jgi:hypothetical protein